jgi:S-adenosylmethionine synthetase
MSMEATSGKNPINHVGKIYNILANQIARDIVSAVEGVREVYIKILSQIGKPIDEPYALSVQVITERGVDLEKIEGKIRFVAEEWLSEVTKITEMVVNGEIDTF